MRLDLDCMRAIVVAIADNLTPDSFGRIDPIPAQDLPSLIPNFPANDIYYWTNQLIESGIIIPGKRYIRDPLPSIKNLSLLGYQFIETACSESVWEKVKPQLLKFASATLTTLLQKAIEIAVSI